MIHQQSNPPNVHPTKQHRKFKTSNVTFGNHSPCHRRAQTFLTTLALNTYRRCLLKFILLLHQYTTTQGNYNFIGNIGQHRKCLHHDKNPQLPLNTFCKSDQDLWCPHPQFKIQRRFTPSKVTRDNKSYNMTRQKIPYYIDT